MKVQGINVVRVSGGKVNRDATIAAFVEAAREKAKKDYVDFCEALDKKLSGAKDHGDVLADAINAVFEKRRLPGAKVTLSRSLVVDQVAGSLHGKEPFAETSYNQMKGLVEDYIRDNSCTAEQPDPTAWFELTTTKGRNGGQVKEINPPTLGNLVAATADEIAADASPAEETIDPEFEAQLAAAADALAS